MIETNQSQRHFGLTCLCVNLNREMASGSEFVNVWVQLLFASAFCLFLGVKFIFLLIENKLRKYD